MASKLESSITLLRSSAKRNSTPAMTSPVCVTPRTKIRSSSSEFRGLKIHSPKSPVAFSKRRQQGFVVSAAVSSVDEEKWDLLVLKSTTPLVLIMLFREEWCGSSHRMKPILDQISNKYEQDVMRCFTMNVKESGSIPSKYGLRTTPIIMFFMSGKKKGEIVGEITQQELTRKIQELLDHLD